VSQKLGNTPTIALQSYISPTVFSKWQMAAVAKADFPVAHFGSIGATVDWRNVPFDDTDDDVELEQTPQDVIDMLGFDPKDEAVQSIAKADLTPEDIADALEKAIMNNTRMIADVGANLVTSRLASYGFLSEAKADGTTTYKLSAILDDSVCPVCEALDGTEFDVDKALARVEMTLSMDDPEDLKVAAPWPDQSKDGVGEIDQSTAEELQAMGYDAPPFHPGCRCILVTVSDEELAQQVQEIPPEELQIEEPVDPVTLTIDEFEALTTAEKLKAVADGIAPEGWEDAKP
jgi:hypothetical protein